MTDQAQEPKLRHQIQSQIKKLPTQRKLAVGLMIINAILLLAFICLVFKWMNKRNMALEPIETQTCVLRTDFNQMMCPPGTNHNKEEDNCCGSASVILSALVTKSLNETFKDHYYSRLLSDNKNLGCSSESVLRSPHKIILSGLEASSTGLEWKNISSLPLTEGSLNYLDGKVYVRDAGYYFIHSQIRLRPPSADISHSTEQSITYYHQIKQYSYDAKEHKTVLENTRNHCVRNGTSFNTTMSTGAVIRLDKRDNVYVYTSHPSHIVPSEEDNRFSLFMVEY